MSDAFAHYELTVLDHVRRPRGSGIKPNPEAVESLMSSTCGDCQTIALYVQGDHVGDVRYDAVGCAVSTASASMMTEVLRGQSLRSASYLVESFLSALVPGGRGLDDDEFGDAAILYCVTRFPSRISCARFPWEIARTLLERVQNHDKHGHSH